jgi:hypothetical protein
MPYALRKRGNKVCVEKQDGSKTFGCHDSRAEAERQLRAIYANTKGK